MNNYIDTRGKTSQAIPFTQAVVDGLAPGGGLYVPEHIPQLPLQEILDLASLPYWQRAARIYKAFDIDLPSEQIDGLMQQAYGANFDTSEVCPLVEVSPGMHVLELWHGPTSAFKDMALQCLPLFFSASAQHLRDIGVIDHTFMILVATSGDTGKAALAGFADAPGTKIGVLFPDGGVSDIQRKQMVTQTGDNVMVWAVRGNFDDCQTAAKRVFSDEAFARTLMDEHKVALSSANSINWGRLLPQVVYYVSAYSALAAGGGVESGELVDICVPTGNFGNILAAWYAKQIGTPIGRLLCASNENHVLSDFINTGLYDISEREFVLTPSPSMDILVSSNLERQLFELAGRNADAINTWMSDLASKRSFSVDDATLAKLKADFMGDWIDSSTCLQTIKCVHDTYNYLLDPHSAVAWEVASRLKQDRPVIVASTAHWAKFGNNVYRALHDIAPDQPLPADVEQLTGCQLNALVADEAGDSSIPAGLAGLDDAPVRFEEIIDGSVDAVEAAVQLFV